MRPKNIHILALAVALSACAPAHQEVRQTGPRGFDAMGHGIAQLVLSPFIIAAGVLEGIVMVAVLHEHRCARPERRDGVTEHSCRPRPHLPLRLWPDARRSSDTCSRPRYGVPHHGSGDGTLSAGAVGLRRRQRRRIHIDRGAQRRPQRLHAVRRCAPAWPEPADCAAWTSDDARTQGQSVLPALPD